MEQGWSENFSDLFNVYLVVLGLSCNTWDVHCHVGSFMAVHSLSSWGPRAPKLCCEDSRVSGVQ